MNISPVSFRSTVGSSFNDIINKPQAFTTQTPSSQPSAATNISGNEKKGSGIKKLLGALVVIGGAVAGIAIAAHKGKFAVGAEANDLIQKVFPKLESFGNAVYSKAKGVIEFVKSKFPEAKKVAEEAGKKTVEATV